MAIEVAGEFGILLAIAAVIVEAVIAVLLFRTVKDFAEVAKTSRIEAKQRFRPWIGPSGGIEFLREMDSKNQYSITIKNFGEIPAASVEGMSAVGSILPTRASISGDGLSKFNLGPLLPYMEKKYWIFVSNEIIEEAKRTSSPLYAIIYFRYEFAGGTKSGYGMISQMDPKSNTFVHQDMWVDQEIS